MMTFHSVDLPKQFKRMRELVPDLWKSWMEFDTKAFEAGALSVKIKQLVALGVAHTTQCPWCIDAHTKQAAKAGATDAEIAETIFVTMAMRAGAAWTHGGLTLRCLEDHKTAAP